MLYSSEFYEAIFTAASHSKAGKRRGNIANYRVKTITSGNVVEVECYPIWNTQAEVKRARAATTREAQRELNARNARKRFIRKVNANFTEADICVTLTYAGAFLPDEAQARRDIRAYIRRVRSYGRRRNLPELKYVYVTEYGGKDGKRRVHHHVILSGVDRDAAETLWNGKGWANARRLQPDEYGLERIARYMLKETGRKKRWCASKNLANPKVTVADRKISRRQAEKIAGDMQGKAGEIFARLYPKCNYNECEVRTSEFVSGAYIYAKLHHAPEWEKLRSGQFIGKGYRVRHKGGIWECQAGHYPKKEPSLQSGRWAYLKKTGERGRKGIRRQ